MRLRALLFFAAVALTTACSSPDERARVDASNASREQFDLVAPALVYKCGTLDCHGSPYRNMRLFGFGGLRLDTTMKPDEERYAYSRAELDADYDAVVGLEPSMTREVVAEGGREPERLTLIRKGRDSESHGGGPAMVAGDKLDRCITSWLASRVDATACREAVPWTPRVPAR